MDVMADLQAQTDILFHLPLDLLGFVHFGLLALLVGLFLSCRFDSGLPSFFVSGFLTVCSFFAFCFHVSASVVAADYLIFMLPDFVMTFIFAGSFGAVVCRSKDPRLLALHLCSILGTMMCLGLATLGALSMGPPILDDTVSDLGDGVGS